MGEREAVLVATWLPVAAEPPVHTYALDIRDATDRSGWKNDVVFVPATQELRVDLSAAAGPFLPTHDYECRIAARNQRGWGQRSAPSASVCLDSRMRPVVPAGRLEGAAWQDVAAARRRRLGLDAGVGGKKRELRL